MGQIVCKTLIAGLSTAMDPPCSSFRAQPRNLSKQTADSTNYADTHLDILEKSIAAGNADLDNSAIIKAIRRRSIPSK